jgi:predicted ATPase
LAEGGVEVDTQGDAFFVAFPTAPGALEAAHAISEALDPGPIRVRIGLHTGTPLLMNEGYVGPDVHRAARIADTAHGGQVVVSASTAALLEVDLRDLGEHRLKDLSAQRIYQLGYREFPPLRSLRMTNLPVPATPFLGRESELAAVGALLAREDVRLLTLTGPGGSGKTRLAAQSAGLGSDAFPDGVWWVPLTSLRDPDLVLSAAAQALGAKDELGSHIGDKRLLVLFDNFEHVLSAADGLADLLVSCPNVKLMATSREPLHLSGEQEFPVEPLDHDEGVRFFVARARSVSPGFEADESVAAICRRVDELPLALELAAARVKALSPAQILKRLDQRLPLLTGGARDAPERQQTLRATIEWSYELLAPDEQRLLVRLSVFTGGWTLEAAEDVAEVDIDTLHSLVDKSLIRFSAERFWMLETIREYLAELLGDSEEHDRLRAIHLRFFLALAEEAEPNLTGPDQRRWYERLALEQGNVRAALEYACDTGDGEHALMLAGTIWRFWWTRGQIAEASYWYDRALAIDGEVSERARARGLFGAAHVAEARADVEETRVLFEEAADLLRKIGDTRWLVLALTHVAGTYSDERAEATHREALRIAEQNGDRRGIAIVKGNLADVFLARGDVEEAARLIADSLAGHRSLGDVYGIAAALAGLAMVALDRGDVVLAAESIRESVELSSSIGDALSLASTLSIAAAVLVASGDNDAATRLFAASEVLVREHGFAHDQTEAAVLSDTIRTAQAALRADFDEAWAAGAGLDLEAAVELALEALNHA